MSHYNFSPIGVVHSPYKEKFAIPRQPGLVTAANGSIHLLNNANNIDMVRGLEQFSHIWLLFVFHATQAQGWKPLVRPPRLGGNKKLGVLATRSTFRPNPIGMSVVKLNSIRQSQTNKKQIIVDIGELDLLDGTPILDIKPYIPYCDAIDSATAGFAQQIPEKKLSVHFSHHADNSLSLHKSTYPDLKTLITQVLTQDPRPAYKSQQQDDKIYGVKLYHFNIQWQMTSQTSLQIINITTEQEAN